MAYRFEVSEVLTEGARALRAGVFLDEQGFSVEFDDVDDACLHLALYEGDTVVGAARMYRDADDADLWHIGRVVIDKAHRGAHLGARVMQAAEEAVRAKGALRTTVSAQCRVQGFYGSLGYVPQGEVYMDEFCPHIRMDKTL